MASTYTLAYSVAATSVSVATLSTAWALVPRDANLESLLSLSLASDTITNLAGIVTRTIVYDASPMSLLGDPQTGDALENVYTESFSQALTTRVTAAAVVFTP